MLDLVDTYLASGGCPKLKVYSKILREQKQAKTYDRTLAIKLLLPIISNIGEKNKKFISFPDKMEMAEYLEKRLRLRRFNV